ncbi:hypothetical protein [Flavisolibacter tropicus]|uniref:Uncharacterized protein n=1 Tax=Flavisolibacter tropicus TaxID=1492898 RepID=A0A172TUD6_9BACT|nr:hypothetical protein [Flavisolibacter tropicus]ANE50612.1 hypothetical protein SY85_08960 [Flavisolibacter tropicus]
MNNTETVVDPLGNEVLLPKHFADLSILGNEAPEVYDMPSKVIEAPALMMKFEGGSEENYYYRSIGWENALLIGTKKIGDRWIVHSMQNNPSSEQLCDICRSNNVQLIEYKLS